MEDLPPSSSFIVFTFKWVCWNLLSMAGGPEAISFPGLCKDEHLLSENTRKRGNSFLSKGFKTNLSHWRSTHLGHSLIPKRWIPHWSFFTSLWNCKDIHVNPYEPPPITEWNRPEGEFYHLQGSIQDWHLELGEQRLSGSSEVVPLLHRHHPLSDEPFLYLWESNSNQKVEKGWVKLKFFLFSPLPGECHQKIEHCVDLWTGETESAFFK